MAKLTPLQQKLLARIINRPGILIGDNNRARAAKLAARGLIELRVGPPRPDRERGGPHWYAAYPLDTRGLHNETV